eukprot:8000828-Pyramimonas_sp.AAC.1
MVGNHWNRFGDIRRVRLRNADSELGLSPELGPRRIVRVILRGAVGFVHLTRLQGGLQAGNHRDRFRDIRRVRLSHAE